MRASISTPQGELKGDPPASEEEDEEYLNYQSVTRYLYPLSADSKNFLKIHRVEKKLPCGQPQQLGVDYLFDEKAMGIELQSLDVVFLVSLHLGRDGRLHEGQSSGEENEAVRGVGLSLPLQQKPIPASPGQVLLASGLRDGPWSCQVLGHHFHPSCRTRL